MDTNHWGDPDTAHATAVDATTLARLRRRLAADADAAGLIDIAYRLLDTPVGQLVLAATNRGLVRVAYAKQGREEVLQELADRISPRLLLAPERLDAAARQIDEYFAHRRVAFDLPLDLRLASGFRHDVLEHLQTVA